VPLSSFFEDAPANSKSRRPLSSVRELAQEFVEPYNLDVQPPLEKSPFPFHDAGHRFANIPATAYGELLQNVHDKAAFHKLYGSGAIHGNPLSYPEGKASTGKSAFVNYGFMPDAEDFDATNKRYLQQGADPASLDTWESRLNQSLNLRQKELTNIFNLAEGKFNKGEYTFFQGSGGYDPKQGFMPSPDLRNTREIAPEDVNTARVRGEAFADSLLKSYQDAVSQGTYKPSKPSYKGMIHAADLAEAGMQSKSPLKIERGWADESFFPYKDKISALSNPPARLDPSLVDVKDSLFDTAFKAKESRIRDRLAGNLRTGFKGGLSIGAADFIPSPEAIRSFYSGDVKGGVTRMAGDVVFGVPTALAAAGTVAAAPALAPVAAGVGLGMTGVAAGRAVNEVVRQQTGEGIVNKFRQTIGTEPRTGVSSRGYRPPNVSGPYVPPTIRQSTPAEIKEDERRRNRNELQRRIELAQERFNPAKGEFGFTELLFGR
jgi:hypothetical protein